MFERFTDSARRVLVLTQEEARLLNHNFIGSEHILLGLIREGDGIAAQALGQLGIALEAARAKVAKTIGVSGTVPSGSPPFTPRAKKVLELSLREALQLGHNYIGTEHILLGIVREGEGVAAQVLDSLGTDGDVAGLTRVRQQVIQFLSGYQGTKFVREGFSSQAMPSGAGTSRASGPARASLVACSFCGRRPPDTGQLISGAGAFICEHCVREWSEVVSTGSVHPGSLSQMSGVEVVHTTEPPPEDQDVAQEPEPD